MTKILIEDSYQHLRTATISRFDTPRQQTSQRVQVLTTAFIPSTQNASLEIRAKTRTDDATYDSIVYLEDVEYVEPQTPNAVGIKSSDNTDYYIMPVSKNANTKVNCSCLDFHHMFAVWNARADSLFGDEPPPYIKKTQRPYRNPTKTPGLCKHLMKLFQHLENDKIIN